MSLSSYLVSLDLKTAQQCEKVLNANGINELDDLARLDEDERGEMVDELKAAGVVRHVWGSTRTSCISYLAAVG